MPSERSDQSDHPDQSDKSDKSDKSDQSDKSDHLDHSGHIGNSEIADTTEADQSQKLNAGGLSPSQGEDVSEQSMLERPADKAAQSSSAEVPLHSSVDSHVLDMPGEPPSGSPQDSRFKKTENTTGESIATSAENERVPVEAAMSNGWLHLKKHFFLFCGISTLAGLAMALPHVVTFFIKDIVAGNLFLAACLFFYAALLPVLYQMGRLKVMLRCQRNEVFSSDDFVSVAPLFFHYFLLIICRFFLVFVGYLFFIVPGAILQIRLEYADYFVIDHKQNAFSAIGNSWRITKGSVLMLILFGVTCGFIETLGLLALVIGLVPARWMTGLAKTFVYERLCALSALEEPKLILQTDS
jgi:hypothetical protein